MDDKKPMPEAAANEEARDFIRDLVQADLARGQVQSIVTRFPPEPNGYLHLGHAKSICLNFGLATEYGGRCHLRFDDTNPVKEEQEYIDAIKRDVRWLGFDWGEHLYHASDYFQTLYDWAEHLIRAGLAYVDDTPPDEMRAMRGTLTEPGRASPDRDRSVEANLGLFRDMRAGKFPNGACVLRAKIDLASGNMNLRDPVLYRILHAAHPRTGTQWCIYPTYDFAHGQSDAMEHVTHSLCTLEFADHRPLYDWFLDHLPVPARPAPDRIRPPQYRLHRPFQAPPDGSGAARHREWLGRSAHADPRRPAPPRRAAGGDPRLRSAHRHVQGQQRRRSRHVRSRDPRPSQSGGGAAHGGPAAAQARDREFARRPRRRAGGRQPSGGSGRRHAYAFASAGKSSSSATTSWRIRRTSSSGWPWDERSGCATPISSPAARWSRTPTATSSNCVAPTIPRAAAATRRTVER